MDINDVIAWLVYLALLELTGAADDLPSGIQLVFVGDAIPGAAYGG